MPITEPRIVRLREFGLSEYAARAYLALLDLGEAEAREVSNLSKVPTSKIYHVLEQLHERGLVEILPEFPKRYSPARIEEFLERRRREHEEAGARIEREREDLVSEFAILGDVHAGDRGGLQVARGRVNVVETLRQTIEAAAHDLLILSSAGLPARAGPLRASLDAALARGVRLRIVAPADAAGLADLARGADLRTTSEAPFAEASALLVADRTRALLISFLPDDDAPARGKDVAAAVDHEGLVAALAGLSERAWAAAAEGATGELARAETWTRRLREPALLIVRGRIRAASTPACELVRAAERDLANLAEDRVLSEGAPGTTRPARLLTRDGRSLEVGLTVTELDPAGDVKLAVFRLEPRTVPVAEPERDAPSRTMRL